MAQVFPPSMSVCPISFDPRTFEVRKKLHICNFLYISTSKSFLSAFSFIRCKFYLIGTKLINSNISDIFCHSSLNKVVPRPRSSAQQILFARFKNGDFNISDEPRSGRPSAFNENQLEASILEAPRRTTHELTDKVHCSPQTILSRPKAMKKVAKIFSQH